VSGESRAEGNFAGSTPVQAYDIVRYALRKELSTIVEERQPSFIVATQGSNRFTKRFEVSLEPTATGTYVRIRVTSPTDWPRHAADGLRRIAIGLGVSTAGAIAIAVSLPSRGEELPLLLGSILLFSAGAPIIVGGWARWRHARRLIRGEATPAWLG
jgi:hypothetical protein